MTNTCGHPERPHRARGLCTACYFRDRRATLKRLRRIETKGERIARRLREYVG